MIKPITNINISGQHSCLELPTQLDTMTPEGRKALGWLSVDIRTMVTLLGLPPLKSSHRACYSRAQLALACVLSGLKRP